ncbi:hypothetical protein CHARACLAT_033201, partial [Characodon lateralis]|nr:hypothetical protein [Characodon lateralis]
MDKARSSQLKEDVSVPEVADQAAFSENQSCTKETVISTSQPVTKNESICETQETVEQQGEKKPFKCKRKKKTPIDWGNYYEQDKCNDQGTSA